MEARGCDTLPTAQVSPKPEAINNEDKPKFNKIKKGNKSEIVSRRHNIKCFFINARSLLSKLKMEELRMYAKEEKLDFIGIV